MGPVAGDLSGGPWAARVRRGWVVGTGWGVSLLCPEAPMVVAGKLYGGPWCSHACMIPSPSVWLVLVTCFSPTDMSKLRRYLCVSNFCEAHLASHLALDWSSLCGWLRRGESLQTLCNCKKRDAASSPKELSLGEGERASRLH